MPKHMSAIGQARQGKREIHSDLSFKHHTNTADLAKVVCTPGSPLWNSQESDSKFHQFAAKERVEGE